MTKKHLVPISRAAVRPDDFTILDFMAFLLSMITLLNPVVTYKNEDNR